MNEWMGEKQKSISPSEIQVKNWWKVISTEEKLDIINQKKVNKLLTHTP